MKGKNDKALKSAPEEPSLKLLEDSLQTISEPLGTIAERKVITHVANVPAGTKYLSGPIATVAPETRAALHDVSAVARDVADTTRHARTHGWHHTKEVTAVAEECAVSRGGLRVEWRVS